MTEDSNSPESRKPSSSPSPAPSARDEAAALVRTIQMNAAEKARSAQEQQREKPRSKIGYVVLLVLFAAANAYAWIAQPAWLVGNVSHLDTPAERAGVLRFRMYVQGQRIEAYRNTNGIVPERLDQTGTPFEGMTYQRTGPNSWELMGVLQDIRLLLRSTDSPTEFLANSQGTAATDGP